MALELEEFGGAVEDSFCLPVLGATELSVVLELEELFFVGVLAELLLGLFIEDVVLLFSLELSFGFVEESFAVVLLLGESSLFDVFLLGVLAVELEKLYSYSYSYSDVSELDFGSES